MQKGEMFIDETITLDYGKLPDELAEYCKSCDEAFEEGDVLKWVKYHEVLGEFAKNSCSEGSISREQRNKIWERYGTAG